MDENRPSPEKFLERIRAEEKKEKEKKRGRLKIFLGYAAGTGKTYTMLEVAHELIREGVDVVAGYIEPHDRPETAAMAEGIEELPFKMVDYKGRQIKEFDLDLALIRHPEVLLVDELAHSNVTGSRHQKRYQDVEELLDNGINVYTTVNIQHLESLNDIVEGITGIKVHEKIPDYIFDEADQVKMVDIEPDELIERMEEGKIYGENQAHKALDNFFQKNKLVALREMGMRRMADRISYLSEKAEAVGEENLSSEEHVMVCVSPSPANAKVLRTAARLANAFHANFTALYVDTREFQNMNAKAKRMRDENMRLARTLGAKLVTVYSDSVDRQIAEYAKASRVTKIVLGKTNHRDLMQQFRKNMFSSVSQYAPDIDIYIIPDYEYKTDKKKGTRPAKKRIFISNISVDLLKTAAIIVLYTAAGIAADKAGISETNIVMMYLLGIIITAIKTRGYLCSMISSVAGVLIFNYLFTEPRYSLAAYNPEYLLTFSLMMTVSVVSSWAMSKIQKQNEENAKRAYRTEILLTNSRRLRRTFSRRAVGEELAYQIQRLVNLTVIYYCKKGDETEEPDFYFRKGVNCEMYDELKKDYTDIKESSVVSWVFKNGHRAGCTTHTLPDARAMYLPVMDGENVMAVVGLVLEQRREIGVFQYDIISAILDEAAFVIERIDRIEKIKKGS